MKKKGKAIVMVVVAALLVGLTIGSSMADTKTYEPVPGETWIASTFLSSWGSTHSSKTITLGDALLDEIGVHGWLYSGGNPVAEGDVTNYHADLAELELYSPTGIYADYTEAVHTFDADPWYWRPRTSESN